MRTRPKHIVLGLAAAAVAAVVLFLLLFDLKGLVENRASAALGHPVKIGTLHVRVFPLRFTLDDLTVAEKPEDPLAKAAHIDGRLAFWRLFKGETHFPYLVVEDATARVTRDAEGNMNWDRKGPTEPLGAPNIGVVRLKNVAVTYVQPNTFTNMVLDLETRDFIDGRETQLVVKGKGTYANKPSTIAMEGGSVIALSDFLKPYPFDLTLASGPTTISAKGTILDPVAVKGLDITMTLKGEDAADLYRVLGVAMPPTPAYAIEGKLYRDGMRWLLSKLIWKMGNTDLAGNLIWDISNPIPRLDGTLRGDTVDLADLGGFVGAAPGNKTTPKEERAQAAQTELAKRRAIPDVKPEATKVAAELVIPDKPINYDKLNSMNAKVYMAANRVIAGFPLDTLSTNIVLQDGVLHLAPMTFGVEKGRIDIDLKINTRADQAPTDLIVAIKDYPIHRAIGKASETLAKNETTFGYMGGRVELHGVGESTHKFVASADGSAGFVAQGGSLGLLMVELLDLDIAESVKRLLIGDAPTPLRCAAVGFEGTDGVMTAKTLVIDTKDTQFVGRGSIDMGREILDLTVDPRPKDFSPAALHTDFLVKGTFAKPSIGIDAKNIAMRGGAAAVLGILLTPLASLLPLIELGGGKDANCQALFAQVNQEAKTPMAPTPAPVPAPKKK